MAPTVNNIHLFSLIICIHISHLNGNIRENVFTTPCGSQSYVKASLTTLIHVNKARSHLDCLLQCCKHPECIASVYTSKVPENPKYCKLYRQGGQLTCDDSTSDDSIKATLSVKVSTPSFK